jgi:hypothetical protein
MAAVGLHFRAELRRRWRAWLGLAVVLGLIGGAVLALAAGARRTDSAYGRFLRHQNASDVIVSKGVASFTFAAPPGPPLDPADVARLPGVEEASSAPDFYALIGSGVGVIVPPDERSADQINRLKILEGRRPDPTDPAEVAVGFDFAAQYGIHVGDQIPLLDTRLVDSAPPDTPQAVLDQIGCRPRPHPRRPAMRRSADARAIEPSHLTGYSATRFRQLQEAAGRQPQR